MLLSGTEFDFVISPRHRREPMVVSASWRIAAVQSWFCAEGFVRHPITQQALYGGLPGSHSR